EPPPAGTGRRRRIVSSRRRRGCGAAGQGVTAGRAGDSRLPGRCAGPGRGPPRRGGPAVAGDRRRRPTPAVPLPHFTARSRVTRRGRSDAREVTDVTAARPPPSPVLSPS